MNADLISKGYISIGMIYILWANIILTSLCTSLTGKLLYSCMSSKEHKGSWKVYETTYDKNLWVLRTFYVKTGGSLKKEI